jgi:hypothetical protein
VFLTFGMGRQLLTAWEVTTARLVRQSAAAAAARELSNGRVFPQEVFVSALDRLHVFVKDRPDFGGCSGIARLRSDSRSGLAASLATSAREHCDNCKPASGRIMRT